jgi:hypothetical protein
MYVLTIDIGCVDVKWVDLCRTRAGTANSTTPFVENVVPLMWAVVTVF